MQTVSCGGAEIPVLGFGTYRMKGHEVRNMVPHALAAGFRHFDTAQFYDNESHLGDALHDAGVPRSEIFITTKVWVSNFEPTKFATSVEESIRKLRTDHVDLLLLHWPNKDVPLDDQIEELEAARKKGQTRHIGVSNFNVDLVKQARKIARSPIVTNQVECHPYISQSRLISGMKAEGVGISAYYGMADGRVFKDPDIASIGQRHGKSPAQVVLRWLVQQGFVALSKTANPERAAENADIFDFTLSEEEVADIHKLAQPNGRLVNPAGLAPAWDD
ncbi:aldo/keto reductase [Rhizobium leguminosarum]|uniref:aldo/keto reductase n=1 Tax=Rhizobium leguminosarum TaxID=384 RepID=UPI001C976607|nr:aldo/keto reductase [Rhizobium leguminosarum]MBY5533696.1 aldo/keto reductase [Rhizobium leguminosarum]